MKRSIAAFVLACSGPTAEAPKPATPATTTSPSPSTTTSTSTTTPTVRETPDAPFREKEPQPGNERALTLPEAQKAVLKNGLTVLLVEMHELPIVSLELVVRAGGENNPPDSPGLASLVADMLDEGTQTRTALQIADAAAALGSELHTDSGWDAGYVEISVLKNNVDPALALLADVAMFPTFPDAELLRVRDDTLTEILQLRDEPAHVAGVVGAAALYGDKHPYGAPGIGTEAAVKRVTRKDLVDFYQRHWSPDNAALIVVGDLSSAELSLKLGTNLGAWTPRKAKPAKLPAPKPRAGRVFLVDKPGAPQSAVSLTQVGVDRGSKDYVPLLVMNRILGGQFASRINLNLREKHGYTYGARSGFEFRRGPGPFAAGGGIRTDVTDKAIVEIRKEIDGIREADVTAEELDLARSGLIRSLPGRYETTARIAREMSDIFLYGLPLDYLSDFAGKVAAVTAADARRVAAQYLDPNAMDLVVVGDLAKIQPGIAALNLGALQVVDAYGAPVKN